MTTSFDDTGAWSRPTAHDVPIRHEFSADGPIDVNVQNLRGAVTLHAVHGTEVRVELTPRDDAARALVERMEISFEHGRLRVDAPADEAGHVVGSFGELFRDRGPSDERAPWPDRVADSVRSLLHGARGLVGDLAIDVQVPTGSRVVLTSGAGNVRVNGVLARLEAKTGIGTIEIERGADGATRLSTGTGDISTGPIAAGLSATTGTGDLTVSRCEGAVTLNTGVGDVVVARACAGHLDIRSGLGDVEVRIAPGTAVRLDLATGFGDREVQLTPTDDAGAAERTLDLSAKSGKGDLRVVRAPA